MEFPNLALSVDNTVSIHHYTHKTYGHHCFIGKLWCLFEVLSLHQAWILLALNISVHMLQISP